MKRTKAQPSLAGVLLIVTGMLLISVVVMDLAGSGHLFRASGAAVLALVCAACLCLGVGAFLSSRKRK